MATSARAVTVTTTATALDTADDTGDYQAGQAFTLYNNGAVTVYIGGPDVTTSNGLPIPAGQYGPGLDLSSGDRVYGIVASGTCEVRVLEVGV